MTGREVTGPQDFGIDEAGPGPDTWRSNERSQILTEAATLINGERNRDYGDPTVNHQNIAGYWDHYLRTRGWTAPPDGLKAHDVAHMMALMKIARQAAGPHRDSNVDAAGYSPIAAEAAAMGE